MRSHILILFIITLFSLALGSCGSSRKAVSPAQSSGSSSARHDAGNSIPLSVETDDATRILLEEARRWIGVRYAYGGHSRQGTDCSGMVMEIFSTAAGVSLPRSSREQYKYCRNISRNDLLPGDLVFFANNIRTGRIGHVGLYVGDGKMVHASSSRGVIVSGLAEDYWTRHYVGSGRVEEFDKRRKSKKRRETRVETEEKKDEKKEETKRRKKRNTRPQPAAPISPAVSEPASQGTAAPASDPQWFDTLPSADADSGQ